MLVGQDVRAGLHEQAACNELWERLCRSDGMCGQDCMSRQHTMSCRMGRAGRLEGLQDMALAGTGVF